MYAFELRLTDIHHVLALPEVEIDNVDGVHLLHMLVVVAAVHVFRNKLRRPEEHALEVGKLRLALHLDEQQFATAVLGQQVHAVVFGLVTVLVTFALQQAVNLDVCLQDSRQEAL